MSLISILYETDDQPQTASDYLRRIADAIERGDLDVESCEVDASVRKPISVDDPFMPTLNLDSQTLTLTAHPSRSL